MTPQAASAIPPQDQGDPTTFLIALTEDELALVAWLVRKRRDDCDYHIKTRASRMIVARTEMREEFITARDLAARLDPASGNIGQVTA